MLNRSYNNEFEKELEKAGYVWFQDNWKNSLRGFQKRITDQKGTKYFITGYHWNFGLEYPDRAEDIDQYSFDVQFIIKKDNTESIIDVRYGGDFLDNPYRDKISLQDVEDFYEKIWSTIGAEYSEK